MLIKILVALIILEMSAFIVTLFKVGEDYWNWRNGR